MVKFERICGAAADAKELEYVSALCQTCLPETRANGTISSLDVKRLLSSRYGLLVSHSLTVGLVRELSGESGYSPDGLARLQRNKNKKGSKLSFGIAGKGNKKKKYLSSSKETDEKEPGEGDEGGDVSVNSESAAAENLNAGGSESGTTMDSIVGKSVTSASAAGGDFGENIVEASGSDSKINKIDEGDIPEEYLDIVQVVSLLLIPTLARAAKEHREGTDEAPGTIPDKAKGVSMQENEALPPTLLEDAVDMILKKINLPSDDGALREGGPFSPEVDVDLVEAILLEMGEYERAQDQELIRDMVDVANSESGMFDVEALMNATTHDVAKYWLVGSEERLSTLFYDVFGYDVGREPTPPRSSPDGEQVKDAEEEIDEEDNSNGELVETKDKGVEGNFDFNSYHIDHTNIDFVVDSHSSVFLVVLIWLFYILSTMTYAQLIRAFVKPPCGEDSGDFGCMFASTLWTW